MNIFIFIKLCKIRINTKCVCNDCNISYKVKNHYYFLTNLIDQLQC